MLDQCRYPRLCRITTDHDRTFLRLQVTICLSDIPSTMNKCQNILDERRIHGHSDSLYTIHQRSTGTVPSCYFAIEIRRGPTNHEKKRGQCCYIGV
jgi:hypothetical protein